MRRTSKPSNVFKTLALWAATFSLTPSAFASGAADSLRSDNLTFTCQHTAQQVILQVQMPPAFDGTLLLSGQKADQSRYQFQGKTSVTFSYSLAQLPVRMQILQRETRSTIVWIDTDCYVSVKDQ